MDVTHTGKQAYVSQAYMYTCVHTCTYSGIPLCSTRLTSGLYAGARKIANMQGRYFNCNVLNCYVIESSFHWLYRVKMGTFFIFF